MDNFNSAAGVQVDSVFIESHNEKRVDITDLFNSLTVYENITDPVLRGSMLITDATGLTADLPIIGQEKIEITLSRGDEYYEYKFRTTHIEKMSQVNDFTLNYVINLVDESFYLNSVRLISQSFSGPISSIISTVYTDFLQTELDTETSFGNYSLVVPRWNPLQTVRWGTRRARTENNSPFVLFATLNNGYQFKSYETLFNQEPVEEYYRRKMNSTTTDADEQRGESMAYNEYMQTPLMMHALSTGPTVEQLHNGAYASRTFLLDLAEKNYQERTFNYANEFDSIPHLADASVMSDTFTMNDRSVFENSDTVMNKFVYSSHSFNSSLSYNADVFNSTPYRESYRQTLNNYRYRLSVNGRFDLSVGSIVDLQLMKNRIMTANDPDDINDRRRSGKHIVTTLKHMITRRSDRVEYVINFDCNRDTMGIAYNETT